MLITSILSFDIIFDNKLVLNGCTAIISNSLNFGLSKIAYIIVWMTKLTSLNTSDSCFDTCTVTLLYILKPILSLNGRILKGAMKCLTDVKSSVFNVKSGNPFMT